MAQRRPRVSYPPIDDEAHPTTPPPAEPTASELTAAGPSSAPLPSDAPHPTPAVAMTPAPIPPVAIYPPASAVPASGIPASAPPGWPISAVPYGYAPAPVPAPTRGKAAIVFGVLSAVLLVGLGVLSVL